MMGRRTRRLGDDARFTVIIPTLQRSDVLPTLITRCADHPLVDEVLVINNAQEPLAASHPRVRVLDQQANIFVNPAWNLGVAEAHTQLVAIVNDDVDFDGAALDEASRVLRRGLFAMVGPDSSCFLPSGHGRPAGHRIASGLRFRYGTFMCMRREDYVPIPSELQIWGGDDWLFWNQQRPNAVLVHVSFSTSMGTTSGAPEFQAKRELEQAASDRLFTTIYGTRWWHRPVSVLERARMTRARVVQRLRSLAAR